MMNCGPLKFGKRSEKLTPGQLALGLEDTELTQAALEAQLDRLDDEKQVLSGGKPRRRRDPNEARPSLPAHLPVVEEMIEPEHLECPCCHGKLHRIGETSADHLDVVPVQYFIRRTVRPKYAIKEVAGLAQTKHRGLARVGWMFTLKAAAYNLVRLPKLLPTG
jgi:transposase